jgi:predicted aspartyl protease
MKIRIYLLLIVFLNLSCDPSKYFFNDGSVICPNESETIRIKYFKDLPFCNVEIGGKMYNFLIDTGAPTLISEEIFQALDLNVHHVWFVTDGDNKTKIEKFTIVPEIKIGNIRFKDIGSVVKLIETKELNYFGIDGIIGANMLAKLFCEFDYQNSQITFHKNKSTFNTKKIDFVWDFDPKSQKTPMINGGIFDKKYDFTFDTGSNGFIDINDEYENFKLKVNKNKIIHFEGTSTVSLYGKHDSDHYNFFKMKTNIKIGHVLFQNEIIQGSKSCLIGNQFLWDYVFWMDWESQKIYFKKQPNKKEKFYETFGFDYLFNDKKAFVVSKIADKNIPINLGDEIIQIDNFRFSSIKKEDIGQYYLNRVEGNKSKIDVKVKRKNKLLTFHLKMQLF